MQSTIVKETSMNLTKSERDKVCLNKFVAEFMSLMEPDPKGRGYSYKEIHEMYSKFMKLFYPNERVIGSEMIRRKVTSENIPFEKEGFKQPKKYLVKPSKDLVELLSSEEDSDSKAPTQTILTVVDKKGDTPMSSSYTSKYKNSERKFESKRFHGDVETIDSFMFEKQYSTAFNKSEWTKFSDFYKDYLEFCESKCYVPINSLTVKKYLEDMTYKVIKLPETKGDSKNLYVNLYSKKQTKKQTKTDNLLLFPNNPSTTDTDTTEENTNTMPLDPIPLVEDIDCHVKVDGFIFETIKTPNMDEVAMRTMNDEIRNFIHTKANYAESGEYYPTKTLYAAFKYYTKKEYSFDQFRYILSKIPAAILTTNYDNNTETSRLIPEFEYLKRMEEKNRAGLTSIKVNNYDKRVTKPLDETMKILKEMEENNSFNPVQEEQQPKPVVEEVKQVEVEETKPIENEVMEEPKYETDDKAFTSVDSAMQSIENDYAGVIRKYKALEEIKQVIKEERVKVHDDLKSIFDMLVDNALKKFESINPTFPSFQKEVDDLKSNLRNLSSFVKKA